MTEITLFSTAEPSFDASFATARRTQLDATSWVDHVPGWLSDDGAPRRFLIRPEPCGRSIPFTPAGGDLIVMGGRAQRDWRHSVPKQKTPAGPRASLNFTRKEQSR